MIRFSAFLTICLFSLTSLAIDWTAEFTGAISQQDCLSNFPNGQFIEVPVEATKANKFSLFYFSAKPFDKQLPTLLYIDGGPGQATGASVNTLRFTNLNNFNVVYFHPRGVGCSQLPADNQLDSALTTVNAADDIELIKQNLGINQWNMVFGLSYGTVSGLKYAEKYPNSIQHLVFEGLFYPSLPRDKVQLAIDKGFPTLISVYKSWADYQTLPGEKVKFIEEQILSLLQTGKIVTAKGVELTDEQVNELIVSLFTITYQGVYSQGSLNRNGVFGPANTVLKLFYPLAELPALPKAQYEIANNLPYMSYRTAMNTLINDSLEYDFIAALADPKKDLATVVSEFFPAEVVSYLKLDTTKTYKIIDLPKALGANIQFTLLLGTEDGATPYENAVVYLKSLQSSYTLYGLKGFGHQRHFTDECYAQVLNSIYSNVKLDVLFNDSTSKCFLPEGFEQ